MRSPYFFARCTLPDVAFQIQPMRARITAIHAPILFTIELRYEFNKTAAGGIEVSRVDLTRASVLRVAKSLSVTEMTSTLYYSYR